MPLSLAKDAFPLRKGAVARVVRWFHALPDETRLQIIDRLSEGEQCVCNLTDLLETGQSRLSFQVKILKDAGILKDRRQGRWVYCSLNPEAVEELERFVGTLKACCRRLREVSPCCK